MSDIRESCQFQRMFYTLQRAAVDRKNQVGSLGRFHNAGDPTSDSDDTEHFANAIPIEFTCYSVGDLTDIGSSSACENECQATGTFAGTVIRYFPSII